MTDPVSENTQPALAAPRCLGCRYDRRGIAAELPCPECGELPPPREWIVLFGSSTETDPWWAVVGSTIMLSIAVSIVALGVLTRLPIPTVIPLSMCGVGLFVFIRSVRAARRVPDGGDIAWVIRPDGVEIRTSLGTHVWPWERLSYALVEYGWRPGWTRLSIGGPGSDMMSEAGLWLDSKLVNARAVQARLRAGIDALGVNRDGSPRRKPGTPTEPFSPSG